MAKNFYNVQSWIAKGKTLFNNVKNKGSNRLFFHLRRVETTPTFTGTTVNLTDQVYGQGNNTAWVRVAEAYRLEGAPHCQKPTIVDELALVIKSGYGRAPKICTNYVFKSRLDKEVKKPVAELGNALHNNNAWCIWTDSFERSPANEYCGFTTFARFSHRAFDRSVSQPYAAIISLTPAAKHNQTNYGDPLYMFTFSAEGRSYGIKLDHTSESGLRLEQIK